MVSPLLLLGFAGVSALFKPALDSLGAAGPHGLSEIVYAYASSVADNGSAFAGLNANTPWYNVTTGVAMFFGRFAHAIPILAIAGSLAAKKKAKPSAGTVPTNDATFVVFLLGVIGVVTALQYLPALTLGPIAEQVLRPRGDVLTACREGKPAFEPQRGAEIYRLLTAETLISLSNDYAPDVKYRLQGGAVPP